MSVPTQNNSGKPVAALSPRQALDRLRQGSLMLDVRESYETNFRIPDVPRVLPIPDSALKDRFDEIPRNIPVIVFDNVGLRAKEIAAALAERGFPEVAWIVGGVVDWVREGLPVKVDRNYELVGQCSCKLKPKNPREAPKLKR